MLLSDVQSYYYTLFSYLFLLFPIHFPRHPTIPDPEYASSVDVRVLACIVVPGPAGFGGGAPGEPGEGGV